MKSESKAGDPWSTDKAANADWKPSFAHSPIPNGYNEGRPPCSPSVDDYLRRSSLGCYNIGEKVQQFFVRVVQCMRVPRGLSDGKGTGSQQAYFQFELPSRDGLLEGAIGATLHRHKRSKYHISEEVPCRSQTQSVTIARPLSPYPCVQAVPLLHNISLLTSHPPTHPTGQSHVGAEPIYRHLLHGRRAHTARVGEPSSTRCERPAFVRGGEASELAHQADGPPRNAVMLLPPYSPP